MESIKKNILVVVAHPDDEVLGCGGTIARHVHEGHNVSVLAMTDGVSSRDIAGDNHVSERDDAFSRSCKNLGVQRFNKCNFPDNQMDSVPLLEIVKRIEQEIKDFAPSMVYTHFMEDLNIDHALVCRAVLTACRPQPGAVVREIRAFEVVSATHWNTSSFSPNLFVDISLQADKKLKSLQCYADEMRPWPHQRSFEAISALEQFRGSTVGVSRAEAFMILRKII